MEPRVKRAVAFPEQGVKGSGAEPAVQRLAEDAPREGTPRESRPEPVGKSTNPGNLGESESFKGSGQGKNDDGIWAPRSSFAIGRMGPSGGCVGGKVLICDYLFLLMLLLLSIFGGGGGDVSPQPPPTPLQTPKSWIQAGGRRGGGCDCSAPGRTFCCCQEMWGDSPPRGVPRHPEGAERGPVW